MGEDVRDTAHEMLEGAEPLGDAPRSAERAVRSTGAGWTGVRKSPEIEPRVAEGLTGAEGAEDFVGARDGDPADDAGIVEALVLGGDADTADGLGNDDENTGPGASGELDRARSEGCGSRWPR